MGEGWVRDGRGVGGGWGRGGPSARMEKKEALYANL